MAARFSRTTSRLMLISPSGLKKMRLTARVSTVATSEGTISATNHLMNEHASPDWATTSELRSESPVRKNIEVGPALAKTARLTLALSSGIMPAVSQMTSVTARIMKLLGKGCGMRSDRSAAST